MKTKSGKPITDAMLEKWAKGFEGGNWPKGKTVAMGRPRLSEEEMKTVTFKMPASKIDALDSFTHKHGQTRSEGLRDAVDKYLSQS